MNNEIEYLQAIRSYHDIIDQKIRILKSKIYERKGWIFVTHTYKKEDLLKDENFNTIEGMINNISGLVNEWTRSNIRFSNRFYKEYMAIREATKTSLSELQDEIRYRPYTNWEKIRNGLISLIAYLVSKLPNFVLNALGLPQVVNMKRLKNE